MSYNNRSNQKLTQWQNMHSDKIEQAENSRASTIIKELQNKGESCKTCKYWRRDIEFCNKKKLPRAEYYICQFHK